MHCIRQTRKYPKTIKKCFPHYNYKTISIPGISLSGKTSSNGNNKKNNIKKPIVKSKKTEYTFKNEIGQGRFSRVMEASDSDGNIVAVKIQNKIAHPEVVLNERNVYNYLNNNIKNEDRSNNIAYPLDIFDDESNFYIVNQLLKIDLFEFIVSNGKLEEKQGLQMFLQCIKGVNFLHKNKIIHRDIKPENILMADFPKFNNEDIIQISDFGFCYIIGTNDLLNDKKLGTKFKIGSENYTAPEVLKKHSENKMSKKMDIWSLGVVLYVILYGHFPFKSPTSSTLQNYLSSIKQNVEFMNDDGISSETKKLISDMLEYKMFLRPDAETIIYRVNHLISNL